MPNKSLTDFFFKYNILQNFHEDRLIIQGRSMYLMFFEILVYLYRWLSHYRDVKATSRSNSPQLMNYSR